MQPRVYRPRAGPPATTASRDRVLRTVESLLEAGVFHMSTMAEIAAQAGVARSTLYSQFDSRFALVDAICARSAAGAEYAEIKRSQELPDPVEALRATLVASVRFWARDHELHRSLHGLVEIDPAAAALVDRQTDERRSDLRRLSRRLREAGALGPGVSVDDAVAVFLVATSFPTFAELRLNARLGAAATERAVCRLVETVLAPSVRPSGEGPTLRPLRSVRREEAR